MNISAQKNSRAADTSSGSVRSSSHRCVFIGILPIHCNKNRLELSGFKWDSGGLWGRMVYFPLSSPSVLYCVNLSLPPLPSFLLFFCMLWECCLDPAKPLIMGLYCGAADSSVFLISSWKERDRHMVKQSGR